MLLGVAEKTAPLKSTRCFARWPDRAIATVVGANRRIKGASTVCTEYEGYTKTVCISGGGSGGSGYGAPAAGGGGEPTSAPRQTPAKPAPKLSGVSCSAAIVSTGISAGADLLWLTGIGDAVFAARASGCLAAFGTAAAVGYADRFAVLLMARNTSHSRTFGVS